MTDVKKRWIPVCFPMGPFNGSVNIALKGANVLSAKDAKELIDATEGQLNASAQLHTSTIHSTGSPGSEGETKV